MKFLLDQNLSPQTTHFLKKIGVDAIDVRDVGLAGKTDDEIYQYAAKHELIIMTYDQDFSYRYFFGKELEGLVLLRFHPQTLELVHDTLKMFFSVVEDRQIKDRIVVVEKHRHRVRKVK